MYSRVLRWVPYNYQPKASTHYKNAVSIQCHCQADTTLYTGVAG